MVSTLYPQLIELLHASGCVFVRQGKGSHEIWRSPINGKIFCVPFLVMRSLGKKMKGKNVHRIN